MIYDIGGVNCFPLQYLVVAGGGGGGSVSSYLWRTYMHTYIYKLFWTYLSLICESLCINEYILLRFMYMYAHLLAYLCDVEWIGKIDRAVEEVQEDI